MSTAVITPTPTITPEVLDESSKELIQFVKKANLEEQSTQLVLTTFQPLIARVNEWKVKIDELIPKDREPTKEEIATIKRTRLDIVKIRTGADKRRKDLLEDAKQFTNTVNAANRQLVELVTPLEEKLEAAEKFAERREQERKAKLKTERETAIAPYGIDTTFHDFGGMSQEAFDQLLDMAKAAKAMKEAAAQKAEQERVAREKAEVEQREKEKQELERLRAEAEAKAKAEEERRTKEEAERKAREDAEKAELKRRTDRHNTRLATIKSYLSATELVATPALLYADMSDQQFDEIAQERRRQFEEAVRLAEEKRKTEEKARQDAAIAAQKAAAERRAIEEKARQEREAREKAEAEARRLKEQAEAEAKRKQDEEEAAKRAAELAAKKAAAAPDKTKVRELAKLVRGLAAPTLTTDAGKTLQTTIEQQIEKFATWLEKQAEML